MQLRLFGRTGHMSTVAIFGAAAFWEIDQPRADKVLELLLAHGVNHIDVAPSYGQAEERVGPWIKRMRERFFLGCKTTERTKEGATAEMHRSLERLQTQSFDLYQIHAITTMTELDQVTGPGGALEAIVEARDAGLTRFIGITGHGWESPSIFQEALRRFDFDSVLFPLNFVQYADPEFRRNTDELIRMCREKDVATMVIKSITRGPWGEHPKTHNTWYQPFDDPGHIQQAVNFALSQDVSGICTAGDVTVLPLILDACEQFEPMDMEAQQKLIDSAGEFEPIFPETPPA
jgi:aryl-alcohol dehydrogenase-like predicted oxidoreductase